MKSDPATTQRIIYCKTTRSVEKLSEEVRQKIVTVEVIVKLTRYNSDDNSLELCKHG